MRFLLVILMLFALPANAQEMSSKYEIIGQMDLMIDGEAVVLQVATIPADGESYATQKIFMGAKALNITGVAVDEDGEDKRPYVSVIILFSMFGTPSLVSIDYIVPDGGFKNPITSTAQYGTREMAEFSYSDGGALELDFTAELARTVLDDDYNQTIIEGSTPVLISGHVSVVIPDEFREEE